MHIVRAAVVIILSILCCIFVNSEVVVHVDTFVLFKDMLNNIAKDLNCVLPKNMKLKVTASLAYTLWPGD